MGRREVAAVVAVLHFCTACYTFVPVGAAPVPGARVAVDVSDDGRVALREQLGPGVLRLEGTMVASEGQALVVSAMRVTPIGGRPLPIDTVRVTLEPRHVERVEERRFARTRTWVAVGTAVAIVTVFLATGGFSGRGVPPEEPPGGPPGNQLRGRQ